MWGNPNLIFNQCPWCISSYRGMSHVIYFIPPPSFWCNFVPYRRYSEIYGYPIYEPPEKIQYWSLRLMNDTNDPELISELKWHTSSIIWSIKASLDSLNPRTIFLALVLYYDENSATTQLSQRVIGHKFVNYKRVEAMFITYVKTYCYALYY